MVTHELDGDAISALKAQSVMVIDALLLQECSNGNVNDNAMDTRKWVYTSNG
jgi:hypothetical protein